MQRKTTKPQTRPAVDREGVRLLVMEIGASAAAKKLGLNYNTIRSWAKRYGWGKLPERAGRPAIVPATDLQRPGDVLLQTHKELETTTKTALIQTAAKAATKAAQNRPLDVSNTSQFRDLTTSSSRIFGWNTKAAPQAQFNQVVISQEQLQQIRTLRASMTEEEKDEIAKRQATPEGREELRRIGTELQERAQNMEPPKLPPTPPHPVTYQVTIRGDGGGVKKRWSGQR